MKNKLKIFFKYRYYFSAYYIYYNIKIKEKRRFYIMSKLSCEYLENMKREGKSENTIYKWMERNHIQ